MKNKKEETKETLSKEAPAKKTATRKAPVKNAPAENSSAENAPAKETPVKQSPYRQPMSFEADLKDLALDIFKTIQLVGRDCSFNELARILRGDQTDFFRDPSHAILETTGSYSNTSRLELRLSMGYLLDEEYLVMKDIRFQGLAISPKGLAFQESPQPLLINLAEITFDPFQHYFHRQLRDLRRRLSDERGLPVYAIYSDHCIDQIVRNQPESLKELTLILGLDEDRISAYGALILQMLDHIRLNWHHLKNLPAMKRTAHPTHQEVKRLHQEGFTVEEIAGMVSCKQTTVERYLCDFHLAGDFDLRPWIEGYLEKETLDATTRFFQNRPNALLREAKAKLGYEYNEIYLAKVHSQGFIPVPVRISA